MSVLTLENWLIWGFAATIVLTSIMSGCQGLGLTRMSAPYMLGTMFTSNRDRAKLYGFLVHCVNGWLFAAVYLAAFHVWGGPTWWRGATIGLVHSIFVLTAGMRILPALHPRMASEQQGPTVVKQLEPPGFLALNYGVRTPAVVIVAHLVFGVILGVFAETSISPGEHAS
jgi:uncharacterized membrane protein YagU involved in acid resistance